MYIREVSMGTALIVVGVEGTEPGAKANGTSK
jgi:hypothetical protein